MASGIDTRNLRHGSLALSDSGGTNTLAIAIDEGNLTFTEAREGVVVKQRGELDHWSKGEAQPVSLSFTIKFDQYGNRSVTTEPGGAVTGYSLRGFLRDADAGLTSVNLRNDIFTGNLNFTIVNPAVTGDEQEVLSFTDFHADRFNFSEGDEYDTIVCEGRALLETPGSVRS